MNQLQVIANDILPVYENQSGERLVNARELHEQLMSKQKFADWIQRKISNYGFVEGEDFFINLGKSTGGRPSTEYLLMLDTGKEIAMVENNEQGRAIRKYFIEVEKRSRVNQPKTQLEVLQGAIDQMVQQDKRVTALEKDNQTLKHRVNNMDKIDPNGDEQQQLNKMVKRYAYENGLVISTAWKHFDQSFNTAFRTNVTHRRNNYAEKHGFKKLTRPQYLSLTDQLDDAIRVADKMLNQVEGVI